MTNVLLFEGSNKNVVGFEVSGHAEYADPGMDIVCSAVSALTITVINSIEEQCDDDFYSDFHQETGYISLHFHGEPSDTALIILRLFRCGMIGLEESYGDYILITFKEV